MRHILALVVLTACATEEEIGPGEPATFNVRMANVSTPGAVSTSTGASVDAKFAPGVLVIHEAGIQLFTEGQPLDFASFEGLVEDGDNGPFLAELSAVDGVLVAKSYASLDEDYNSAPMGPGDDALLTETVDPGLRLSLVAMYGESNDVFVATPPAGIELFDAEDLPLYGEIAAEMQFWDAGTEVNEEPGVGPNQPARQAGPNTGDDENGVVAAIGAVDAAGFGYPAVSDWLSVELYAPSE